MNRYPGVALALFLTSLILSGCVQARASFPTVGNTFWSPAYKPNDLDIYAYGNFCGPRYPNLRDLDKETQIPERIERIRSIAPVDDIDAACKAHDLCYERWGHDHSGCDFVLAALLRGRFKNTNNDHVACSSQSSEIESIMFKPTPGNESLSALELNHKKIALSPLIALGLSLTALNKSINPVGYPASAGYCKFTEKSKKKNIESALSTYRNGVIRSTNKWCAKNDDSKLCPPRTRMTQEEMNEKFLFE